MSTEDFLTTQDTRYGHGAASHRHTPIPVYFYDSQFMVALIRPGATRFPHMCRTCLVGGKRRHRESRLPSALRMRAALRAAGMSREQKSRKAAGIVPTQ